MIKIFKQFVKNQTHPEGSIAEAYIVNEALTFCSMYLCDVETKFTRPKGNQDERFIAPKRQLSIFQHVSCPIEKKQVILLEQKLRKKAEWYIMNNCPKIQPISSKFYTIYNFCLL